MTNRVNPPACLPVFSLSLSLLRTHDHIDLKPVIILTVQNAAKKAKKVDLRIICPKDITKILFDTVLYL